MWADITNPGQVKLAWCHHGMVNRQVADGGGLQMWNVAANIWNMELTNSISKGHAPVWIDECE
jgi:hypothetical protein